MDESRKVRDYMGIIHAVCISEKKGTQKSSVKEALFLKNFGLQGDAHGGNWHRQVSLLSYDKIKEFNQKGANVTDGAFGENLIVEGLDFGTMPVGTILASGEVQLEITQIGKECHSHCAIYRQMGDCIMPREGVFAKVLQGGMIQIGDEIRVVSEPVKNRYQVAIITLSDQGYSGKREDESGVLIQRMLEGYDIVSYEILPDEQKQIEAAFINLADRRQVDLILTTGGTGFSKRDLTPEATMAVATRNVPGVAEAIRAYSMTKTKRAMLSRGVSVIRNRTWIINLPGSKKAVEEILDFLLPELEHGLGILTGRESECARK